MIISGPKNRTFCDYDLQRVFEEQKKRIAEGVSGNEDDAAISQLATEYRIEPIVFDEAGVTVSSREEMIPARWFPNNTWVDSGKSYPKTVVRYHVPFSGERMLLRCRPSTIIMHTEEVEIDENEISFDIINWNNDSAQVKSEMEIIMKYLREQNNNVTNEVRGFNDGLRICVGNAVDKARAKKDQNNDFMSSLGVPRRPRGNE